VKKTYFASLVVLLAGTALAQAPDEPKKGERIEVTGSSIKRTQEEGPLPLQIITREDIRRAGVISAEQLMEYISANGNSTDNLSSATLIVGVTDLERRNNNGNASANLRGLGAGSTLILLNGRRVSTHGLKANSVDLNSIPLAAVERVEILKDGASAIYGTDAIGGVINFILRRDYEGAEVSALADTTEGGGGNRYRGALLVGGGQLDRDGYNFMASLAVDRQEQLHAFQRSFSNGYQPDRGLAPDTAGSPFASQTGGAGTGIGASFKLPGDNQAYNRANLLNFQGKCNIFPGESPYDYLVYGPANYPLRYACAWDYAGPRSLIQPIDRVNFVSRGTWRLAPEQEVFVEFSASRSKTTKEFEQRQITTSIAAGTAYPVGGPYYQDLSAYIPTFDRTKPIAYRWRCMDCGPRVNSTDSDAYRLLVGMDGTLWKKYDYKLGASYAGDNATTTLNGGYFFTTPFNAILASGRLNPWLMPGQTQTPDVIAALNAASASGVKLADGRTMLVQGDGQVSGEIMPLAGGPLAFAAGFDYRRESYVFGSDPNSQPAIADAPFDSNFDTVTRRVFAQYAELSVPLIKGLDTQLAVRHDHYSDFGDTTNPKVAVAYRPIDLVMVRGSYSEGFHAPSFVQLYSATTEGPVPANISDPVYCPLNPNNPVYCSQRPNARTGGNPTLKPETAKEWTFGLIVEPVQWFSGSFDVWQIHRTDRVYSLTPQQVVANYTTFPDAIVRNADNTINYIRAGFVNADGEITRGIDVGLRFKGVTNLFDLPAKWGAILDGTYIDSYRTRIFKTDPYTELAGQWDDINVHPRWKHTLNLNYTTGPYSGTLTQRYTSHYRDWVPPGTLPPGWQAYVKSYTLYDLMFTYTGIKKLTVTAGVKNILDTDPSFTDHDVDFLSGAGWDPRVADPRGRAYIVSLTYQFK
jgi:iron complex outermembrane receptor protein